MRQAIIAAAVLAVLAAACGSDGVGSAGPVTTLPALDPISPTTTIGPTTTAPPATVLPGTTTPTTAAPSPTTSTTVPEDLPPRATRVYFLLDSDDPVRPGPLLVPVHREIPGTLAVATNSIAALLAGPTAAERAADPALSTAIPDDVELNGISVADGIASIDLSESFAAGAGTFAEFARLGQIVYTLTQFPTVDSVELLLDGVPVTEFASHGIGLDRPQTRADYETLLPFIFVDGPAYGGRAGNPLRVTGVASVFEATFEYELLDTGGGILAEGFVTGGSGIGFGPFDFTVAYDVAAPQLGSLVVFEISAVDGQRINERAHPVELKPAA